MFARLFGDITRAAVQRMLANGEILVNGEQVKASYTVNIGDIITVEEEEVVDTELKPQDIPLDIIYEDDDILVINKEKGMVVHPRKWESRWNFSQCSNGSKQREFIWSAEVN